MQKYLDAGKVRVSSAYDQAELVIVDRNDVKRVLNKMLSHLILKKKQAIIAFEIISQIGDNLRTNRISDENYSSIITKIKEIRSLNSKTGGKRKFLSFDPVTTSR